MTTVVELITFASLKNKISSTITLSKSKVTAAELIEWLKNNHLEHASVIQRSRIAQNNRFLNPYEEINTSLLVYIVPPSSGG